MMLPVVALVGRPNVGKSTLFNRLTRSRDALVADLPGLTRDRHYGRGRVGEQAYLVIDTGGFEPVTKQGIYFEMAKQTRQAISEADVIIFLVDGRQGLTAQDQQITDDLRKTGRPIVLAVNKTEGMSLSGANADFYQIGLGEPLPISAAHGDGIHQLIETLFERLPQAPSLPETTDSTCANQPEKRIKLAVVGRPNVGKSTLINTFLGEERVIAFDLPGTTRDSIYIDFDRANQPYTLIDTAGLRRRGKVFEAVEKFSVVKTLQAIADAHVVLLLLDAHENISDQDAHIAGFVVESGRALVVGVNKWDQLDTYRRDCIKRDIERKLKFLNFAQFHFVSALRGQGVSALLHSVKQAYAAAFAKLSTPKLTRALIAAVERQAPPRKGLIRPKLRYAHQGGQNPPVVIVHGNALQAIPESYRRYLETQLRDVFSLRGTPLRVEFRCGRNPFIQTSS